MYVVGEDQHVRIRIEDSNLQASLRQSEMCSVMRASCCLTAVLTMFGSSVLVSTKTTHKVDNVASATCFVLISIVLLGTSFESKMQMGL